jgi:hypothetical protein
LIGVILVADLAYVSGRVKSTASHKRICNFHRRDAKLAENIYFMFAVECPAQNSGMQATANIKKIHCTHKKLIMREEV